MIEEIQKCLKQEMHNSKTIMKDRYDHAKNRPGYNFAWNATCCFPHFPHPGPMLIFF